MIAFDANGDRWWLDPEKVASARLSLDQFGAPQLMLMLAGSPNPIYLSGQQAERVRDELDARARRAGQVSDATTLRVNMQLAAIHCRGAAAAIARNPGQDAQAIEELHRIADRLHRDAGRSPVPPAEGGAL